MIYDHGKYIKALQYENKALKSQVNENSKDIEALRGENASLKSQVEANSEGVVTLMTGQGGLIMDISDVRGDISDNVTEIDALKRAALIEDFFFVSS